MLTSLRSCYHRAGLRAPVHRHKITQNRLTASFDRVRCYTDMSSNEFDESWKHQVRIAENQDEAQILSKLKNLLEGRVELGKQHWQLCVDGQGIRRSFHFKTFNKTWVSLK